MNTYKIESVCTGVFLDVFRQITARHPFRDELERSGSDTEERDDIFVFQAFPQYGPPVERLRASSAAAADKENNGPTYFCDLLRVTLGVHLNSLDANL